ncbi:hypothetical protein J6590_068200 [Homalodisca vitripennis]|nr:hypothetical protein J6590_068200 [Homalodisca vitripennis]
MLGPPSEVFAQRSVRFWKEVLCQTPDLSKNNKDFVHHQKLCYLREVKASGSDIPTSLSNRPDNVSRNSRSGDVATLAKMTQ